MRELPRAAFVEDISFFALGSDDDEQTLGGLEYTNYSSSLSC
jgi:hypothetical protein